MKKHWIWILFLVVLSAALLVLPNTKSGVCNQVRRNQAQLTECARTCMDRPGETVRYGSWDVRYDQTYGVVVFQVSYTGFGSQSDETGVYYSPLDAASGLGNDLGEELSEQGVKFLGDGDNYTYVEKITDHWYWFRRHW